MRITGGVLSGWSYPKGFASHVRPSTDRVRESLFNLLNHRWTINGCRVLDLFSGSGIIAGEFLSYGADEVISVDRDFKNIQYQKEVHSKSEMFKNWKIKKRNVFTFLSQNTELFDIVFADPPYDLPNIQKLPDLILPHLKKGGLFVLEHAPQLVFPQEGTLKKEYGSTSITIFVSND